MSDTKVVLEKLDKLDSRLNGIDIILVKQEANLEKHMIRTDQNEELIQILRRDFEPVQSHVHFMTNSAKFIVMAAGVLGFLAATYSAIK